MSNTFQSITHKFSIGQLECYLIVAVDDGRPIHVECKNSKTGSTLRELAGAWCAAITIAFEMGATVDQVVRRFKGVSFAPSGVTSNPDIPEAPSLVDYICRWLELEFCKEFKQ